MKIAARALAALEDGHDSDVGTGRNGGGRSATTSTSRPRAPSAPRSAARASPPPREAQRRGEAMLRHLKPRFKNYGVLHGPADGGAARSRNGARRRRSPAERGISQSTVRSPSRNAARSRNSPGRAVLGPRDADRAVANDVVVRRMKAAVSQNENGEHPLTLPEMYYSPFSEGKDEMAESDDNTSRGDSQETSVSSLDGLVDLTGDDSGEDVSQPMQGPKNIQEMYRPFIEGKDEMAESDDNTTRGDPRESAVSSLNGLIDLTGDDSGEDVSQTMQGPKRPRAPSTPQSAARGSSPPRKVQKRGEEVFGHLKPRFKNYGVLHSPADGSAASSQDSTRYRAQ